MRLLSLTVRNYRVHKDLSITFDPSRNLIGGSNESGKSTLAEAAHRALFLRAKTGGSIQKEMVSTVHTGDPEVVLRFEAAGGVWELEKRFTGARGGTRLSGTGGATFRDEEADGKLSEILKTESGGRATQSNVNTSWSHLWVWQGRSGEDPAAHATLHKDTLVHRLQKDGIAAVMQSANDQRVRERIAAAYDELFTTTGRPKAGSKPEIARTRLAEAEQALDRARETAERLEQAVIDHARAEKDLAEVDAALPGLRKLRAGAEEKLNQVDELRRQEQSRLQALQAATTRREEIATHDARIREIHRQATAARETLGPAEEKQKRLMDTELAARESNRGAEAAHREAAEALRQARARHDLATARMAAMEKSAAHQQLAARAREADAVRLEITGFHKEIAELPALAPKDLANLRKLDRDADQAKAGLEAMATGIELLRSETTVHLDGQAMVAGQSHILTDAGELSIGGETIIRIHPGGGASLAGSRARAESAETAFQQALARLGVNTLDEAMITLEKRQAYEQKAAQLEARWNALDGRTIASQLLTASDEANAANAEVRRRTDALAGESPSLPPEALGEEKKEADAARETLRIAETTEATTRTHAERLRNGLQTAADALQTDRDRLQILRQSLRDLETKIEVHEQSQGDAAAREAALAGAARIEQEAGGELARTRASLVTLGPENVAADLARLSRSITGAEARRQDADGRRLIARDRLTLDGSSDPHADLSHATARHEAAHELHASEQRRAKAIEQLHGLFSASREAIDRNLVQPLADRISSYLKCLFGPGAEVRVNLSDDGIQGLDLIRAGDPAFGFATLSGGAREQVAAATRLAMAEILAADHDGCLPVVFDDAFAYTDPERVMALQRMLDLAALRGLQVIVLTCTANDYSALGALEVRIG